MWQLNCACVYSSVVRVRGAVMVLVTQQEDTHSRHCSNISLSTFASCNTGSVVPPLSDRGRVQRSGAACRSGAVSAALV